MFRNKEEIRKDAQKIIIILPFKRCSSKHLSDTQQYIKKWFFCPYFHRAFGVYNRLLNKAQYFCYQNFS